MKKTTLKTPILQRTVLVIAMTAVSFPSYALSGTDNTDTYQSTDEGAVIISNTNRITVNEGYLQELRNLRDNPAPPANFNPDTVTTTPVPNAAPPSTGQTTAPISGRRCSESFDEEIRGNDRAQLVIDTAALAVEASGELLQALDFGAGFAGTALIIASLASQAGSLALGVDSLALDTQSAEAPSCGAEFVGNVEVTEGAGIVISDANDGKKLSIGPDGAGNLQAGVSIGGGQILGAGDSSTARLATAADPTSIAIGNDSKALAVNTTAIGESALANGINSSSYGGQSQATGNNSTAMGQNSQATQESTTALGRNAEATAIRTTALGVSSEASGVEATATGFETTASGAYATTSGSRAIASGNGSTASGAQSEAIADFTTAVGYDSLASAVNSTATGSNSQATGNNSTAIGQNSQATQENATALGRGAIANGVNSLAVGASNKSLADGTISVGSNNNVSAIGSSAFGNNNVINSADTFVLGSNVNNSGQVDGFGNAIPISNTVTNSVYLGNNTVATAGNTVGTQLLQSNGQQGSTTTAGNTGSVTNAVIGSVDYNNFAASTANGVISVGSADDERRIQNVAAGELSQTSTDGVNGSQLYAVARNTSMNRDMALQNKSDIAETKNALGTANDLISDNALDIIAANKAILQNSTDILKNSTDIQKNSEGLTTANDKISKNITDISKNAQDLIKANDAIEKNTNGLRDANTAITANTDNIDLANEAITKNTNGLRDANIAIDKNTGALITTNDNVTALGSAVQQNTNKLDQGITFNDGNNSTNYQLGDSIAVRSTNQNLSVQTTAEGIKVGLNNDIQLNSIQINNGPSLSSNGIDAANTRITNVSAGVNYNDAVNVGQLSRVFEYSQQGDEIAYKGIAMSAALSNGSDAVARPGQLSGMLGVGNFRSNTAMALGITYLSKESNYKLTGGFAYAGSNDILYQGGIAFAIGR